MFSDNMRKVVQIQSIPDDNVTSMDGAANESSSSEPGLTQSRFMKILVESSS
jgi:hypothetical protein